MSLRLTGFSRSALSRQSNSCRVAVGVMIVSNFSTRGNVGVMLWLWVDGDQGLQGDQTHGMTVVGVDL